MDYRQRVAQWWAVRSAVESGFVLLSEEGAERRYASGDFKRNWPARWEELLPGSQDWKNAGLRSGHAWAVCDTCGEPRLVVRGSKSTCIMTPACKGKMVQEKTQTPLQTAKAVGAALYAISLMVMGDPTPAKRTRKKAA